MSKFLLNDHESQRKVQSQQKERTGATTYIVDITITSHKLKSIIPIYNPRYDGGLHQL